MTENCRRAGAVRSGPRLLLSNVLGERCLRRSARCLASAGWPWPRRSIRMPETQRNATRHCRGSTALSSGAAGVTHRMQLGFLAEGHDVGWRLRLLGDRFAALG